MAPDTSILQASHIHKQVKSGENTLTILQDINLSIKAGESAAILGASGSGKTTLLTLLAGLDLPSSGDIYLDQQHINRLSEEERAVLRANHIGFVFQSFLLLPTLSALENVMLPLELQYVDTKTAKDKAIVWLKRVGLAERLHHLPTQLSGGEQQRVAIARAFVNEPRIVFADEMTGNLDTETGKHIADIIFDLNKSNQTTLVLVTHDAELAARCQHQFHLSKGMLSS